MGHPGPWPDEFMDREPNMRVGITPQKVYQLDSTDTSRAQCSGANRRLAGGDERAPPHAFKC
jgi:hypothetical protein